MKKYAAFKLLFLALLIFFSLGVISFIQQRYITKAYAVTAFTPGDFFISAGKDSIYRYTYGGSLLQQLHTLGPGGSYLQELDPCFDTSGNLYSLNYNGANEGQSPGDMSKFNNVGTLLAHPWGGSFTQQPSTCVIDASNNIYVGVAVAGTPQLRKYDTSGSIVRTYTTTYDNYGVGSMDLASDQCTLYYTSWGKTIKRYNVCTGTQLSTFVSGIPTTACFALRIVPSSGNVLVQCATIMFQYSAAGSLIRSYSTPEQTVGVVIDPDQNNFWTLGLNSGNVYKININTGTGWSSPVFTVPVTNPSEGDDGLGLFGEPRASTTNNCPCFIKGDVYTDVNRDTYEQTPSPDLPYTASPQPQLHLTGNGQDITVAAGTNGATAGNYQFTGLPAGTYTITLVSPPAGNVMLYPTNSTLIATVGPGCFAKDTSNNPAHNFTCDPLGNQTNLSFGFNTPVAPSSYSISGNIFDDKDNDGGKYDGTDVLDASATGLSVTITGGPTNATISVPVSSSGHYDSGAIAAGTYTVSFTPPGGYTITQPPKNGPPPQFGSVTIGSGCAASAISPVSPDAVCSSGNILTLNFGITNLLPWTQVTCSDMRVDGGFTNPVPASPVCGANTHPGGYAVTTDGTYCSTNPGTFFSGSTSSSFAPGKVSANNWIAGGDTTNPETFSQVSPGIIRVSYDYLMTTAQQSGITPLTELASSCGGDEGNCTLSATLPHGVYLSSNDLHITSDWTVPAGNSYVILVNGDLTLDGQILMPPSSKSSLIIAAAGNIIIGPGVGAGSPTTTTANIAGLFSAGKHFIVLGNSTPGTQDICQTNPSGDKRLNIEGSITYNAELGATPGIYQNQRTFCSANASCPTVTISARPDLILYAPAFIKHTPSLFLETAPDTQLSPTNTPTVTPIPTLPPPTPTPTPPYIARDTFNRTVLSGWGTATDGQNWGAGAASNSKFSVSNPIGYESNGAGTALSGTLGPAVQDVTVLVQGSMDSYANGSNFGPNVRFVDGNNLYKASLDTSTFYIQKRIGGTATPLATVNLSTLGLGTNAVGGTNYSIELQAIGINPTTLNARIWQTSQSRPNNPTLTVTDGSAILQAAANAGVRIQTNGTVASITYFQAQ